MVHHIHKLTSTIIRQEGQFNFQVFPFLQTSPSRHILQKEWRHGRTLGSLNCSKHTVHSNSFSRFSANVGAVAIFGRSPSSQGKEWNNHTRQFDDRVESMRAEISGKSTVWKITWWYVLNVSSTLYQRRYAMRTSMQFGRLRKSKKWNKLHFSVGIWKG